MGRKNKGNKYRTVTNMVDINPIIPIATLNCNSLNISIKRYIYLLPTRHLLYI